MNDPNKIDYFVKYDGCDDRGLMRLRVSWNGPDPECTCFENLGTLFYGLRGFTRDGLPCFALVEQQQADETLYLPQLWELLGVKPTSYDQAWNRQLPEDRFISRCATSIFSVKLTKPGKPEEEYLDL